jgi:hypothetical protein
MVQKELRKLSQWFWKGFSKWYDGGGGGEWNHIKKNFWSWSVFLLSKYWLPLLFEETPKLSFFLLFFSCSVSYGLGGFDDICRENHFFKNFFLDGFNILVVDTYSGMELCTSTWLNHDYGHGGVVDILVVDAYSEVDVYMPIFFGEASKIFFFLGSKSFLKKIKT